MNRDLLSSQSLIFQKNYLWSCSGNVLLWPRNKTNLGSFNPLNRAMSLWQNKCCIVLYCMILHFKNCQVPWGKEEQTEEKQELQNYSNTKFFNSIYTSSRGRANTKMYFMQYQINLLHKFQGAHVCYTITIQTPKYMALFLYKPFQVSKQWTKRTLRSTKPTRVECSETRVSK